MLSKSVFSIQFLRYQKNLVMAMSTTGNSLANGDTGVKKLFTPGPLLTKQSVKEAMLTDYGSRDIQFTNSIDYVRSKLLEVAGVSPNEYVTVLMQGSGTFGNEACIQTMTPRDNSANYLIVENGAYGLRLHKICQMLGIKCSMVSFPEDRAVDVTQIESYLSKNKGFTHVGVIHNETTAGVLNDVEAIGKLVKKYIPSATYFVDAMSAFGAIPVDFKNGNIDYLVTSSNKCIEGVPGFAIVIANKQKLLKCKNNSRSLSLDLVDQYEQLEKTKQFRFTPPTHTIIAFRKALEELISEGGPAARYARYTANHKIVRDAMLKMGFTEFVPLNEQGRIINTFRYPNDPNFKFDEFYQRLSAKGMVIYPGKLTKAACFRIGNIGDLHAQDMHKLADAIRQVCAEMNMSLPLK